jgi:hypothetical protein
VPTPFNDITGYNVVNTVGTPVNGSGTSGFVEFVTGNDYLKIDTFVNFNINGSWVFECDVYVTNAMDSIYFIDWRSNSSTGHMNLAYNGVRGFFFSDRNLNGIYGSLVRDPNSLPINQWVSLKMVKTIDSLLLYRNGIQTAAVAFNDSLSAISTTTIGYSEDFRYAHASFSMDNIKLNGNLLSSINTPKNIITYIGPNPVHDLLNVRLNQSIKDFKLSIYDVLGKVIIAESYQGNSLTISTQTFNKGIYFVKIDTRENSIIQKIVIE